MEAMASQGHGVDSEDPHGFESGQRRRCGAPREEPSPIHGASSGMSSGTGTSDPNGKCIDVFEIPQSTRLGNE